METVDQSGKATSLVADDAGNVHISYGDDLNALHYGFRPAGSSRWFTMKLKAEATYTNIRLDAHGNPHICATWRKIAYVHFDGRKWHVQTIGQDVATIEFSCAVAIGADGTPHMTWYRIWEGDATPYAHTRYVVLRDGAWEMRTIDFEIQTGKWHAMVLDAQGRPYISYDSYVAGLMKCAYWNDTSWQVSVVDSRKPARGHYNVGMGNSILVDPQGKVHVAYYTEGLLKYARREARNWGVETVDTVSTGGGWNEYRSSVILDKQGVPHICYEDGGAVKHAYWDGQRWRIQVISPGTSEQYRFSSMTIDKQDTLYIGYRDGDGSLKVAVGRFVPAAQTVSAEQPKQD